jgi:hypothetical protein
MLQMKIYKEIFPLRVDVAGSDKSDFPIVSEHTLSTIDILYAIRYEVFGSTFVQEYENKDIAAFFNSISSYRRRLQSHFENPITGGRTRFSLLILAAFFLDAGVLDCKVVDWDGEVHYYRHEKRSSQIAERFANRIILSKAESQYLAGVVINHTKPLLLSRQSKAISTRDIYRYFLSMGGAGIDTAILSIADSYARDSSGNGLVEYDPFIKCILALFDAWWNKKDKIVNPKQLISGDQVMRKFKLSSGPLIGFLLATLKEEQASGNVTTQKDAYQLIQKLVESDVCSQSKR